MTGRVRLALVVAAAENGVIGAGGKLPWRLPADLRRFRRLTFGKPVLMGRRTFESLPGVLAGRTHLVLTRGGGTALPEGVIAVADWGAALARAAMLGEWLYVIGGAAVFEAALPQAERLYLTRVHDQTAGDVHFPAWNEAAWRLVGREAHRADARHAHDYTFLTYMRAEAS